jgi:hypothetical protein
MRPPMEREPTQRPDEDTERTPDDDLDDALADSFPASDPPSTEAPDR